MPQYMMIKGIKGNVTARGYENAIELMALDHVGVRPIDQNIGTPNHDVGLLDLGHLHVVKSVDGASAVLWQLFFKGKMIPKLEIVHCIVSNDKPEWITKLTLSNVMISSMHDTSNGQGMTETLTLAFSKMERGYRMINAAGQWQAPKHTSFDLPTAAAG
jgi:type VI protein secretion system component Hcp